MKIIDVKQGEPAWFEIRRSIPSASNFDRIMTPKTCKLAAAADEYICELVAEKIGTFSMLPDQLMSKAILHGIETEPEARNCGRSAGWVHYHGRRIAGMLA